VIEIPDPPTKPVCAACGPLTWLWSHRRSAWFSFTGTPGDREVLRVHHCQDGDRLPSWRDVPDPNADPDPAHAERTRRGAALVRAALASRDLPDL
jgi:hypothetical protein